jgi:hypothetical protein
VGGLLGVTPNGLGFCVAVDDSPKALAAAKGDGPGAELPNNDDVGAADPNVPNGDGEGAGEIPNGDDIGWENGPGDAAVVLAKGDAVVVLAKGDAVVVLAKGDGALGAKEDVANPANPTLLAGANGEALGGSAASIPESIIVDDVEDVNGVSVGALVLPKGWEVAADEPPPNREAPEDTPPPNGEAPEVNGDCNGALKPVVELPPKDCAVGVELPNGWAAADVWNGLDTFGGPNGLAVVGCCVLRAEANDDFPWSALPLAP